jgi:hypothetical protein
MKHQTIFSILCAFFVLALIPCVMAQEDITIEPVWEFFNNSYGEVSNPHFPFMIALDGLGLGGTESGNGKYLFRYGSGFDSGTL